MNISSFSPKSYILGSFLFGPGILTAEPVPKEETRNPRLANILWASMERFILDEQTTAKLKFEEDIIIWRRKRMEEDR